MKKDKFLKLVKMPQQKLRQKFQKLARLHKMRKIQNPQQLSHSKNFHSPKLRLQYIVPAIIFSLASLSYAIPINAESKETCPDLRIVFARGSGGVHNEDANYLAWKNAIDDKLKNTAISYDFTDLDYPAVAVGFGDADTTLTTLGAYIGSGEVYKFGESVNAGIAELTRVVNKECPDSKYVIGGYSQGAMVISKSLATLNPDKIIYAATFGDPKIYLPEGEGIIPAACKNENLSDYRMYVPDCQAYKGMLGAVEPYRPEALAGKVGTWCNKYDIFCSSSLSVSDHIAYVAENLYEDAAKVINAKVTAAFNIENHYSSLHDTAIVIDSTSSMQPLYEKYKSEALRLARETFASNGRVALYSYRDLAEAYNPLNHCSFETCTLENITEALNKMELKGGGDDPESLLSASLHIMKEQKWRQGATKSLIVLTDAGFHSPDLDGTTLDQVVALSHSIDPVNFYIITTAGNETKYHELATRTDGRVITETDSFSLLTDYILDRYDSLPRVDERSASEITARPTLTVTNQLITGAAAEVTYDTDAESVLVAVNDVILGLTTERQITITGLDFTKENILTLTPITSGQKGASVSINLNSLSRGNNATSITQEDTLPTFPVPKAPNTGRGRFF